MGASERERRLEEALRQIRDYKPREFWVFGMDSLDRARFVLTALHRIADETLAAPAAAPQGGIERCGIGYAHPSGNAVQCFCHQPKGHQGMHGPAPQADAPDAVDVEALVEEFMRRLSLFPLAPSVRERLVNITRNLLAKAARVGVR